MRKNKICKFCRKEFTPTTSASKFCCDECRLEYYRLKYRKSAGICETCGEVLPKGKKKYCSKKCFAASTKSFECVVSELPPAEPEEKKARPAASKRWAKMSLREISAECARFHLTYGEAQVLMERGELPDDFGKKTVR